MAISADPRSSAARRLPLDAGFALPSAIIVLFALVILTAAAATLSVQSSTSTTRDTSVKAELEAAETGLQVATYRLGQVAPSEAECVAEGKKVAATTGNWEEKCKDSWEELGNGASFRYFDTLPLTAGKKCGGREAIVKANEPLRCVTAEGKVNGVEPAVRLQIGVRAQAGEALFPVKGILGLNKVLISGSVKVPAMVASNGEIIGEGSANFEQGYEVCEPGKFKPAAGAERNASGVKIHSESPGPTPGYEKTRSASECPIKAPVPSTHATPTENDDSRIGAADKLEGPKHTWNTATYEFKMEGGSENKLVLGESGRTTKYFFCNFSMPKGSPKFIVAAGAQVEIYIGNHSEYPSTCATGTGKFEFSGGAEAENETKNPASLLIEMGGEGPFTYAGGTSATLEASIYAPNAKVELSGNVGFKGGIVGKEVFLKGSSKFYEWSSATGALTSGAPSAYKRQESWEQCAKASNGSEEC